MIQQHYIQATQQKYPPLTMEMEEKKRMIKLPLGFRACSAFDTGQSTVAPTERSHFALRRK